MSSRAAPKSRQSVTFSDDEIERAAEGSGFSVAELRALLEEHGPSAEELADAARFFARVAAGKEKPTRVKL